MVTCTIARLGCGLELLLDVLFWCFFAHLQVAFCKLASSPLMMSNRPVRPSSGAESNMYDDQPHADDHYRGSAQGYQNSRKGNRQLEKEPHLNLY
jgi:hypothetical protein